MAEVDHMVAKWITSNMIYIILLFAVLWLLKTKLKDLRQRWFAFFLHQVTKKPSAKLEEVKKDIFASLGSIVSHDPELRKNKAIKILEIGVGTGLNFSHYPDGSDLVAVDPNPHFSKYYNDNRKKFPNIHSCEVINSTGEEMDMIPDNSVDAVVMTLVMCSAGDNKKMLQQILRVLVPGGKFYFMEHIREFDPEKHGLKQKLQDVLSVTGIWPFLFDGCYLNRDMLSLIEGTGFSKVTAERFYAPVPYAFLKVIEPHLKGVAEK